MIPQKEKGREREREKERKKKRERKREREREKERDSFARVWSCSIDNEFIICVFFSFCI